MRYLDTLLRKTKGCVTELAGSNIAQDKRARGRTVETRRINKKHHRREAGQAAIMAHVMKMATTS